MVGALLHPAHRSVMAGLEPAAELEPGAVGGIGAREAAGGKAQPLGFGAYCFLKGLAPIHGRAHTPHATAFCKE